MDNRILAATVRKFAEDNHITNLPEFKQFEYFTNYSVYSSIHPEAFSESASLNDFDVDEDGTFGLDSIAIFVNGNLIGSPIEIDDLVKSKKLDVEIVFIQSKTSKSLDSGEVLKLIEAAKKFLIKFDGEPDKELVEASLVLRKIFDQSSAKYLNNLSPRCRLVFSYTGDAAPSTQIERLAIDRCDELETSLPDFKSIKLEFWNANKILYVFREVENNFEVELRFKNHVALDDISDVKSAYIGYIESDEFLKLIESSDGQLRRNVFYDNVRDFQGLDNSVNAEMSKTATSSASDKFVIFNNGVTIVTPHFQAIGASRFLLRGYQIVNGCQTANILYSSKRDANMQNVHIPIKIVHTEDSDVVTGIIRANNRQTPVPEEAFLTLNKWHKDLQDYFEAESSSIGERLLYERRSREFAAATGMVDKKRVIGLHALVRAFSATFLQKPHMVQANNPTSILKQSSGSIFSEKHKHAPYFASALLVFKITQWANENKKHHALLRYRYHVAMIIVTALSDRTVPSADKKDVITISDKVIKVALNTEKFSGAISEAFDLVARSERESIDRRHARSGNSPIRSSEFTDKLISIINS